MDNRKHRFRKPLIVTLIVLIIILPVIGIGLLFVLSPIDDHSIKGRCSVTSPHGVAFEIEYEFWDSLRAQLYANISQDDTIITYRDMWAVAPYTVSHVTALYEIVLPEDPLFREIYYSPYIQCYTFFDDILVYCVNGQYSYTTIKRISHVDRSRLKDFEQVARVLAESDVDDLIKRECEEFLNQ